jgi:hypothetical protein
MLRRGRSRWNRQTTCSFKRVGAAAAATVVVLSAAVTAATSVSMLVNVPIVVSDTGAVGGIERGRRARIAAVDGRIIGCGGWMPIGR